MNRTLPPLQGFPLQGSSLAGSPLVGSQIVPSQDVANWFGRQEFALPAEQPAIATAHSCFAPMHYESDYAYPLIVWLHGPGSSEDELSQVMPLISTRNHVAIAPRGTHRSPRGTHGAPRGSRQVESDLGLYRWDDTADGIAEAGERVADCIAIATERFHIHPDRIFIAGHSSGGTMAHRLGIEFPEQFAGAISLGGEVPRGSHLLKNINQARQLPLMLAVSPAAESDAESHASPAQDSDSDGDSDSDSDGDINSDIENDATSYSIKRIMDDVRFLHCAGLSLSLQLFPEGDELTTVMFKDLNSWVMKQSCPTSTTTAS